MKKNYCLFIISILFLLSFFYSCGTTDVYTPEPEETEIQSPKTDTSKTETSKKPSSGTSTQTSSQTVTQKSTCLGFGYLDVEILNYYYDYSLNDVYKKNINISYVDDTGRNRTVVTDSNGFFYIPDLKRYKQYSITGISFAPVENYPESKWNFTFTHSFSFTYEDAGYIGDFSILWNCTGNSQIKKSFTKAIPLYENRFGKKYNKPVYKTSDSYLAADFYRTNTVDSRMVAIHEDYSYERVRYQNPDLYIQQVCRLINQYAANDFEKVKLVHDIICLCISYDSDAYFSSYTPSQDYLTSLSTGKSVCAGFANVFNQFCNVLQIPCETVTGYAKGVSFNPNATSFRTNHDWNIVKINGFWYLVDCTWDEGYMSGRTAVKDYDTYYLFAKPETMIYSHFPENPDFQLLDKKFTSKDIIFVPNFKPEFFYGRYGFNGKVESFNSSKGTMLVSFTHPDTTTLTISLVDSTGRERPEYYSFGKTSNGSRLYVSIDEPGVFCLNFKSSIKKSNGYTSNWNLSNSYYFNTNNN